MKRFKHLWALCFVLLTATTLISACKKKTETPTPEITNVVFDNQNNVYPCSGNDITINGKNFSTTAATNVVKLSNSKGTITCITKSATDSRLVATVVNYAGLFDRSSTSYNLNITVTVEDKESNSLSLSSYCD